MDPVSGERPAAVTDHDRNEAMDLAFRDAMRHLAGGVCVVTVGDGTDRTGFTATSVTSLSVEPPAVLFCVNRQSSSWPMLQRHRCFGINILAPHHRPVAERFAGRGGVQGSARYDAQGVRWITFVTGAPLLEGAMAAIDCEVEEMLERYSHAIVIGRVQALQVNSSTDTLVYWRAGYHQIDTAEPHP